MCLLRLRLKISVPYQSLQAHVSRLQRLQQASDILRRTSRFVVLSRRLEAQMRDMDGGGAANQIGRTGTPIQDLTIKTPTHDSFQGLGTDHEDEKERTIAKAALSIAELSKTSLILYPAPSHTH